MDGTITNASPNISSAGQCQWFCPTPFNFPCSTVGSNGDIGKKIFVTNACSPTVCFFGQATTSTTVMPGATQLAVGRIATITDATHIIIDCTSPANCATPNASASTAGNAVVVYGTDDTININAAWNAAVLNNFCTTIHFPSGASFFNDKIMATSSPSGSCQSADNIHSFSQIGFNGQGITVEGEGYSTFFIPTPDMNYANCSIACVGGVAQGTIWKHFTLSGMGQSLLGAAIPNSALFSIAGGSGGGIIDDVEFNWWGSRNINTSHGVAISQYSKILNSNFDGFGGYSLFPSGNTNIQISNNHIGCGGLGCILQTPSGRLNSDNNIFDGPTQGNNGLDIQGDFISVNDRIEPISGETGGPDVLVRSGGNFDAVNFKDNSGVAASFSLQVLAGGIARLLNYRASVAHTTGLNNAGTVFDLGGNFFNGAIVNSGNIFGSNSITGTAQTAGNFSAGAGMGTSTFGTVTGDSRHGQVTITYAGALTATPIFTMTFPTTFFVTPTCTLQDVAGTNPFPTQIANGAISTTSATFNLTFAVAPTAANTDTFVWNCSN